MAHSYGGVPATEVVAGAADVAHIVYVAAYMPDVGEGMFRTHGVPVPESLAGLRPAENPDLNLPTASYDPTVRDFYAADLEEFDEAVHKTLA